MMRRNTMLTRPLAAGIPAMAALAFLLPVSAFCQGLYNASSLYVNGADIHVDGEIENSGSLSNAGVVSFTGDWKSQGDYHGGGTLELTGQSSQKMTHSGPSIHTVITSGWGAKYIKGILRITHALHLNQGILHVSPDDALRLDANAEIFGGSQASFVDGAITTTGTGYKFFPTGKNGTYAPIEFMDVRGKTATYSVEVFENAPAIAINNVIIHRARYWQRKDLHGQFGGSRVAVTYDPTDYRQPDNMLFVTGTSWDASFRPVRDVFHSTEAKKIVTVPVVTTPLLLLGEISDAWHEADLFFSTALSPNAAFSENRSVKLFGSRMADDHFRFQVFSRWGELVYETASREGMATNGWDGRTVGGRELPGGTYPYKLSGFDKMGAKLEKKGVITIIH